LPGVWEHFCNPNYWGGRSRRNKSRPALIEGGGGGRKGRREGVGEGWREEGRNGVSEDNL
jgi:hypothetical protein